MKGPFDGCRHLTPICCLVCCCSLPLHVLLHVLLLQQPLLLLLLQIYHELAGLQELRFNWRDKVPPNSLATSLSGAMQHYPDRDLLLAMYHVPQVRSTTAICLCSPPQSLVSRTLVRRVTYNNIFVLCASQCKGRCCL